MCIITCPTHQPSVWTKITFIALGVVRDCWRSRTHLFLLAQLKPQNYSTFLHDFHSESFNTHEIALLWYSHLSRLSIRFFVYQHFCFQAEIQILTNAFFLQERLSVKGAAADLCVRGGSAKLWDIGLWLCEIMSLTSTIISFVASLGVQAWELKICLKLFHLVVNYQKQLWVSSSNLIGHYWSISGRLILLPPPRFL